ncbi:MAG TPA: competence/damage-inducible protein A [Deltaproteobacteria bacterium]|nr:competence/damage-inducible protein A [Deltaproteobacteria bacterium]
MRRPANAGDILQSCRGDMKVGILTIGNELISGRTADANASFIAREINQQGWGVEAIMSVGDDFTKIKDRLNHLLSMTDAVICTGGLGPTADDITSAAIAAAFGLPLYTDEKVLNHIKEIFAKYNLRWIENNAKQAMFPQGAEVIENPVGTAAGFFLKTEGKLIFVIPGVPAEARRMMPEGVIPILHKHFPQTESYTIKQTIKTFGLSEAAVDNALKNIDFNALGVSIGFYPVFPENHIVIISRQQIPEEAQDKLEKARDEIANRLKQNIFHYGDQTLEEIVAGMLIAKKLTLAVAESCTGGLIASRLTDVPGSSNFLERGLVTYSNKAKMELLGVPAAVLEKHGAVSEETARLMAEGARKIAATDLGLSSTGIAGPTGGSKEKPAGTVYLALADGKKTNCRHFAFRWDRRRNKLVFSEAALMFIYDYLSGRLDNE